MSIKKSIVALGVAVVASPTLAWPKDPSFQTVEKTVHERTGVAMRLSLIHI